MEKKMTGYPSIDKPWLKYYSEEAVNAKLPECTLYEYLLQNNKDHLDDIALIYFGKELSYRWLFNGIDAVANALFSFGIRQGDIVSIVSVSTPEVICAFYGINKIGAISNWIDPRRPKTEIVDTVASYKSRLCFVFEDFASDLSDGLISMNCQCVRIRIGDSLPFPAKALQNLQKLKKKSPNRSTCQTWRDFLLLGKNKPAPAHAKNSIDTPAILVYTGGTTGRAKAVTLSNNNINAEVSQFFLGIDSWKRGERWLTVGYPFIAYALICGIHVPLSKGITGVICLDLDSQAMKKLVQKHKINYMTVTPVTWDAIATDVDTASDYSFLKYPIVGADKLSIQKEIQINDFLEKHHCTSKLAKGYGMTELSAAVSCTLRNSSNKLGSVGIPFVHTVIAVFDSETETELPYHQQGEICVSGPTVMLGYFQNQEETDRMIRTHADGSVWLHTGDCGHMDSDGALYIDGRYKRIIINHIGYKSYASTIETVIQKADGVTNCCVVGIPDHEHSDAYLPFAYIQKSDDIDQDTLRQNILAVCEKELMEFSRPVGYCVVDNFPYTGAGKIDFRALERRAAAENSAPIAEQTEV